MAIHWAYKSDELHRSDVLEQGDVLKLSDELTDLLVTYHPYYAKNLNNRFYIVLTQSCDLVQRDDQIKANYIAIAPVRQLPTVIRHEFGQHLRTVGSVVYGSTRLRSDVERFLERLFNNNEPSYFYLEPVPTRGFSEPMCAILPLAISFKAINYKTFLNAKLVGLDDSFQAKLGWLLGQLYSRVGTRDFDKDAVTTKARQQVETLSLWVDAAKFDVFESRMQEIAAENPEAADVEKIISSLPSRKMRAIDSVIDVAVNLELLPEGRSTERFRFRQKLENDAAFSSLFRD